MSMGWGVEDFKGQPMKRILAVNPWIEDFAAFDFWLKPLGLLRIAGILKDAGAEVFLLDLVDRNHPWLPTHTKTDEWGRGKFFKEKIPKPRVVAYVPRSFRRYGLPREILEQRLAELPDADAVILTSGMTYWYKGVSRTIKVLRKRYPDTPFILGGVYASLMPEHARTHSGADAVITGSAEIVREKLGEVLRLKLRDRLPFPSWELYTKSDYAVIETSKGCPFSCTYCASRRLNPGFWPGSTEDVLSEMSYIRGLGITRIAFYDDALLYHPGFEDIMEGIAGEDFGFQLHTPNGLHISRITPRRAKLMRKAGVASLYLSVETTDKELLDATGPKLNPAELEDKVRMLRDEGFEKELHAYVLFGLAGQSEESVKTTLDKVIRLGLKPHLAEFSPVPGTPEYHKAGFDKRTDPLLTNNTAFCSRKNLGGSLARLKDYLKNTALSAESPPGPAPS